MAHICSVCTKSGLWAETHPDFRCCPGCSCGGAQQDLPDWIVERRALLDGGMDLATAIQTEQSALADAIEG